MFNKSLLILSAASLLALPAAADARNHRGNRHHHGYSQRYYGVRYVSPYYGSRYYDPYYDAPRCWRRWGHVYCNY